MGESDGWETDGRPKPRMGKPKPKMGNEPSGMETEPDAVGGGQRVRACMFENV